MRVRSAHGALLVWLACAFAVGAVAGTPSRLQHTERLRLHEFHSDVFGNVRTLRVLVPPDYDDPRVATRRYPALYLNDGQQLFGASADARDAQEWRVDETVTDLVDAGLVEPLIVVGIDNAGRRDRFHEYFPWVDAYLQPPDPDPQGTRYPAFLLDEVVPFIEARYRVEDGPARRGIGGASAGALAALYAVVARPGAFGRLLIESPSVYVNDYRILAEAQDVSVWPLRVHLGVGTNETNASTCDPGAQPDAAELVRDVRRLAQTLHAAGVPRDHIQTVVTPCGRHEPEAWGRRLSKALTFLYPRGPRE